MRRLLICTLLLAAAPAAATECLGVGFSSAEEGGGTAFSVAVTSDLKVSIDLTSPVGDRILEVRLFTPRGHLFQSIAVPVSDAQARTSATRKVPGYPRPLTVVAAEPEPPRTTRSKTGSVAVARVDVPFALAGTSIISGSLYGTWTVEVHLDGAETACATATVELQREPWIFDDGLERGSAIRWSAEAP